MKQGSLHRWLVVLLLLFAAADTGADLTSPELCCEKLEGVTLLSSAHREIFSQTSGEVTKVGAVSESKGESPASPCDDEEECFCCCAHILPGVRCGVASVIVEPPSSDLGNSILPTPPPSSPFHPPRLS